MTVDEQIRRFIDSVRRAQAAVNFEIAKAELRKLGITITQHPGEYHVSLTGGPDENVLTAETLDEAIALGLVAKAFAPHDAEGAAPPPDTPAQQTDAEASAHPPQARRRRIKTRFAVNLAASKRRSVSQSRGSKRVY